MLRSGVEPAIPPESNRRTRAGWGNHASAALLYTLVALCVQPAQAQDGHHGQGHAQHHDWYRALKQPGTGMSCCSRLNENEGDCRPVRAYYDDSAERWMALIDGGWQPVPPRVVIKDDNLNLEPFTAHACVSKSGVWHCFLRKSAGG